MITFLIILALIFIIYRLAPYFLSWFITRKANQFTQNAQNRSRQYSQQNTNQQQRENHAGEEEKIFSKEEGEYVNFEEVKEE